MIFILGIHCQRSANYAPWSKSSLPPVFVNQNLIEYGHVYSFNYYLWLLLRYDGRIELLHQRLYGPQSLRYLVSGFLQKKKNWPTFCLHWKEYVNKGHQCMTHPNKNICTVLHIYCKCLPVELESTWTRQKGNSNMGLLFGVWQDYEYRLGSN